jgi:hypothetical protein
MGARLNRGRFLSQLLAYRASGEASHPMDFSGCPLQQLLYLSVRLYSARTSASTAIKVE